MRIFNFGLVVLCWTALAGFSQSGFAIPPYCDESLSRGMEVRKYSVDVRASHDGRVPVPEGLDTQTAYDIVITAGESNTNLQVIHLGSAVMDTNTKADPITGYRVRGYFSGLKVRPDVAVQVVWKQ